jgi:hypothetical protein
MSPWSSMPRHFWPIKPNVNTYAVDAYVYAKARPTHLVWVPAQKEGTSSIQHTLALRNNWDCRLWGTYKRLLCNFQAFLRLKSDPSGSMVSKATVLPVAKLS